MTLGFTRQNLQYLLGPVQSVSAFFNRLCLQTETIDMEQRFYALNRALWVPGLQLYHPLGELL